jgi:uncharacterized repeat protein (TIGR01451 family)
VQSVRSSLVIRAVLAAALLIPLAVFARAGATPSTQGAAQAPQSVAQRAATTVTAAETVDHRRTEMDLDLVSRSYDPGDNNWTIVAEATLTSNRICLPLVFNCIVGEVNAPANASLENLKCDSPGWNHLLVFRNHCMKQLLFAGHDQKFTFTWTTKPGVNSGKVDLEVEFGRGILPHTFQQLATAKLTVDLDVSLDITKSCPTEVGAGAKLTCTITVHYPTPPAAGPVISEISLVDKPDTELTALLSDGALTHIPGPGTWDCAGLSCTSGELSSGESATFEFTATVANHPLGGDGVNTVSVNWNEPIVGGPLEADDAVVVKGTGDTSLEIEKTTSDTEADPGGPITWTVKVTNAGPLAATDVVVNDIAPAEVDGLTLTYATGVGEWTCGGTSCKATTMAVGSATFTAAGTVSSKTKGDTSVVNEVGVTWANNILGPDFPITAGSAVAVVASATTTTTPTPTAVPGQDGVPLTIAG